MGSLCLPNHVNLASTNPTAETIDDLLTEIVKGKVVLVLGHEGILNESLSKGGNVKDYMYQSFIGFMKKKDPEFNVSCKDINDYFYRIHPDLTELKDDIVSSLSPGSFSFSDENDYSPLLFELLKRKYFRLVLTTTYDYYVEAMMEKAWGKKPRVLSIYDAKNDIEKSEIGQMEIEPTLYYVFGRAETNKDYVLIENDAMKVTEKWFSDKPENLLSYLGDKTILAMGTKFDDWLFRFFWFMLHRDIRMLRRGKVAISLNPNDSESDKKLCQYLDNEKIRHLSMSQTIRKILDGYDTAEQRFLDDCHKQNCNIFISYHSPDFESVKHFFCSLDEYVNKERIRTHIWFDKNPEVEQGLKPGDEFMDKIRNAINQCSVFVPVITRSVQSILEREGKQYHFFLDDEWEQALSRKNLGNPHKPIHIIPICLDGLEYDNIHPNEEHQHIWDLIKSESVGTSKTIIEYKKYLSTIKSFFI